MNEERWLPVVGYESLYEISSEGNMKSMRFNPPRAMACGLNREGYPQVGLCHRGDKRSKTFRVHRLVLEAFVGKCPDGMEALHGQGGRADARLDNLSWGTPKKNQGEDRARDHTTNRGEKCGSSKLTWDQIQELKAKREAGAKVVELGEEYGINPSTVSKICKGKRWQHGPSEW
jgi:hypothetical protein